MIGQLIQLEHGQLPQGAPVEVEGFLQNGQEVVAQVEALTVVEVNGVRRLRLMFLETTP